MLKLEKARDLVAVIVDSGNTDLTAEDVDYMDQHDLDDFLSAWGWVWDGEEYEEWRGPA